MSFLSFGKKEEEVSLLIDIGSGTVSVALVSFSGEVPTFIYFSKDSFPVTERPSSSKLILGLEKLLDQMIANIVSSTPHKLSKVLVSFSSPWYIFKSKEIHLSENQDFFITTSFLNSISEKEEALYQKEIGSENSDEEAFTIIEKYIVHAKINGYTVKELLGKKTRSFDAFMHISAIPRKVEEKVVSLISKHTHISRKNILLYTFPLIAFSTIRDESSLGSNFLLMDITGEVTDISLVTSDVISKNTSLPIGRNYVIRKLAKSSKVSLEIAESMLHMYFLHKSDEDTTNLIEKVLTEIEEEWSVYFDEAFQYLCGETSFPTKIFVTADEDIISIFVDFLKIPKSDSTAVFRKNMNLTVVNLETLASLYKSLPLVEPNEFIVLLSIFYHKLKNIDKKGDY